MLKYFLKDNKLTPDPDDYRAVTVRGNSNDMEDIIDVMMHRPVGVSRVEVASVLEELLVAIEFLLKRGESITTPLFKISPVVSGVFVGQDEAFDRSKHQVRISVNAGTRMSSIAREIEVERVSETLRTPEPVQVTDMSTNVRNQALTPGEPARIQGSRLKVDVADAAQGVFLVNEATDVEVKAGYLLDNVPKTITFIVPDTLPSGNYRLEVRSTLGGTQLRTGKIPVSLTVA